MDPIKCRVCGRIIEFAPTKKGAQMPVEPGTVYICVTGKKTEHLFLAADGRMVRGHMTAKDSPVAETGRIPHYQHCRRPAETKEEREERRAEAEKARSDTVARLLRERFGIG